MENNLLKMRINRGCMLTVWNKATAGQNDVADVNIFYESKYLCLSGFRILFNGCWLSSAELGYIASDLYKDESYFWGISKSYHVVDKDNHKDSCGSVTKIYFSFSIQNYHKNKTPHSIRSFVENQMKNVTVKPIRTRSRWTYPRMIQNSFF